ncbi:MAG TPA: HAD-IA family hydrolase [Terriglobales bacterium]|jgi:phosphoglycolate phosphatase
MVKFNRPFDATQIKLLIFDLDGTLVDSRRDLVESVNAMLQHFHRPELPGEVVASYVGDGAPMLVRRALGDPDDERFVQEALEFFLSYYRVHKLDHTQVYQGVKEALEAIRDAQNGSDRRMAVLSNKPVNPSRAIVDALGLGEFFVRVYGGNSFQTKKPDPLGVNTLLEETGTRSDEAVMIGDSSIDVITGRNADLWTCGVTYGFAPRTLADAPPDVIVDTPNELAEVFVGLRVVEGKSQK